MILALCAAVASAVSYGVATILQALGARRAPGLAVIRQPLTLAGLALDGVGWLASLAALDRLPLFVVQTIVGSSLIVVVLLAVPVLGIHPRRSDLVWVVIIAGSLTVLAAAGGEQPAMQPPAGFVAWIAGFTMALAVGAAVGYRRAPAWALATLAALGYGVAAIAARAAHAGDTLWDTVFQPLAVVLLAGGAVGVLCFLRAIERGSVGMSAAILSVGEVIVPTIVGIAVLGDVIRTGWVIPAIVGGILALAGCVALASSPANQAAEG